MRLIDADALYAKLGKMAREPYYQHDGEDYYIGMADAIMEVKVAPTIEAEPVVHGRWLIHKGHFHDFAECSLCGEDYGKDTAMAFNYCPNCGAKMDGERKSNG